MTEYELIARIASGFRRHPGQLNSVFASDAELLRIEGRTWAITVDDFSPEEDLFTSDDPEALGANLAVATLSDLLACGADPTFFLAALSLPPGGDERFALGLSAGLRRVLDEVDCCLVGGDLGTAATWRVCGVALGPVAAPRPLTRVLPEEPQRLWTTGELGDANLAAFLGTPTPRFELRWDAARAIRRLATACTDTSGGLLDAAWGLLAVSPGMRIEIDLERVPLPPALVEVSRARGVPAEAGLVGGAGEYELLFATPAGLPAREAAELASLGATEIGAVAPSEEAGLFVAPRGGPTRRLAAPPPCPRAAACVEEHIAAVVVYARAMVEAR